MQVSEVMNKDPVCCSRTTSVMNAARMMRQFHIGFLPVVDEVWTRHLMGAVTDRDLCLAALVGEHDPTLTTVEDCMTTELVTCTPDADIREVVADMEQRQVRRVPVIDRDNNVLGVIGISDLLMHSAIAAEGIQQLLHHIMMREQRARAQAA